MTAKEYLNQLININQRIEALELAIEKCYSKAEKVTSAISDTPNVGSRISNKIEDNVINVIEHKQQIEKLKVSFEQLAYHATIQINRIKDNALAALLMNKYVCGLAWEEVAEKIDKNVDYTKSDLHSKALSEFEKVNQIPHENPLYSDTNDV